MTCAVDAFVHDIKPPFALTLFSCTLVDEVTRNTFSFQSKEVETSNRLLIDLAIEPIGAIRDCFARNLTQRT